VALQKVELLELAELMEMAVEGLKLGLRWRLKQHLPLEGLYSFL
jgi:hypothetical protein